jgi:hypothetical protein
MNRQNRLGRYRVRKGYRGLGEGSGRVYEAVHAETGRPAVVVAPGRAEDWRPEADWQVRAEAHTHPPHLVLAVEEAPAGATLPEVTLLLHRLAGATSRLEGRPDAEAHLTGRQVARRERRPPARVRWLLISGNLAAALLALAVWWLWPRSAPTPATPVDVQVPISGAVEQPGGIGRDLPKKPFEGQKPAPCTPRSQVELIGACWLALEVRPPCPEDVVEHGGKCYAPVFTAPRPPSSILP